VCCIWLKKIKINGTRTTFIYYYKVDFASVDSYSVPPDGIPRGHLWYIQGVPEGNVNILGSHITVHSNETSSYVHASYSESFPRWKYWTVQ
jgi:hypothetical protein